MIDEENSIDILKKIEESMEESDFQNFVNNGIEFLESDCFDELMND